MKERDMPDSEPNPPFGKIWDSYNGSSCRLASEGSQQLLSKVDRWWEQCVCWSLGGKARPKAAQIAKQCRAVCQSQAEDRVRARHLVYNRPGLS